MRYNEEGKYFAQAARAIEPLVAKELLELGASEVKEVYRGVEFHASQEVFYKIIYCSRLASRILAPIAAFACHSTDYLYKRAEDVPWESILKKNSTFAVYANVSNSKVRHSRYAALKVKDAIADRLVGIWGSRPDVDTKDPQVAIHLYMHHNHVEINLDAGGGPLHKRGYRQNAVHAPMSETVAAAIIRLTGWQGEEPLTDLCTGSGTLLCEALMHYCRIPASFLRNIEGIKHLPDFDSKLWQRVKGEAKAEMRELPAGLLYGHDINGEAIYWATGNLAMLPYGKRVQLEQNDFRHLKKLSGTLVANPPYGIRMGNEAEVHALITELGNTLKHNATGAKAFIYLGDKELVKKIGLRTKWKKTLFSGALEGRLVSIPIY